MPAEARGSAYRTKTGWGVRWLQDGHRHHQSGFRSKSAALAHFRDEVRPRLDVASSVDPSTTLADFVELYLAHHADGIESSTLQVLRSSLRRATQEFGDTEMRHLERKAPEVAAWRSKLAQGSRVGATKALRQCLDQAIAWGVITRNPARLFGKNREPKRPEILPFGKVELDHICGELDVRNAAIVRFAAETGMRPCEWLALEWRDVRRDEGVVLVERSWSRGVLRSYGKTTRSRRRVPLSQTARDALASITRRIDTPLVFPAAEGGRMQLGTWQVREWKPALEAAGIDHGTIYTLRHTFATNAIAAGIGLFDLSRFMGTSVKQIDLTYGHLAPGAEDAAVEKLNAAAGRSGV